MTEPIDSLAAVFKALADPTRLRLVALLLERRRCGQEIASALSVAPATVSHHLRLLRRAGLISETRQTPYTFYEMNLGALHEAVKSISDPKRARDMTIGSGQPEEVRKVLRTFFDGPRLVAMPAQHKKKEIVLEEILRRLPRRKAYTERELSQFIEVIHADFCTIRRWMVMSKYMSRDNGRYQLTERGQACITRA